MEKEIKIGDLFNDNKKDDIRKTILAYDWMPWEQYLLWVGERSVDYAYTKEVIYENRNYFIECWKNQLSSYKALEFFSFELDNKQRDEKTT